VGQRRLAGQNSAGWRFRFLSHGRLQWAMTQLNRLTISLTAQELSVERIDECRPACSAMKLFQPYSSFLVQ